MRTFHPHSPCRSTQMSPCCASWYLSATSPSQPALSPTLAPVPPPHGGNLGSTSWGA